MNHERHEKHEKGAKSTRLKGFHPQITQMGADFNSLELEGFRMGGIENGKK